jgi:hypothetical protein
MLKKFDDLCEIILVEGRKSDDKKKFKVNVEKAKQHVNEIGDKHHHYRNDKSHFLSIIDELNPNTVYTPKTFTDSVKSIMKGVGKPTIADGYSKLLYSFLKDRVDSPFEDHNESKNEENQEKEEVDHEDLLNEPEESEASDAQNS